MRHLVKNRNFWIVLFADVALLSLAYLLAFIIRYDSLDLTSVPQRFLISSTLPFVVACKLIVFYYCGLYRGVWRYTGIHDLLNIVKAATLSSVFFAVLFFYAFRLAGFPRSVLAIDWLLSLFFVAGFRFFIRLYHSPSYHLFRRQETDDLFGRPAARVNLLILGAGSAGEKTLRGIRDNPKLPYRVIGFLDDNPKKKGLLIHGLPVLGRTEELTQVMREKKVQEVLIAIPSASGAAMRRIVSLCREAGARFKTIPGLSDLINGRVAITQIREVAYEDLLGREPIRLDDSVISQCLSGKRILVTGAGGSIGSELCRQIARFVPDLLICYERAENALFHLETRTLKDIPHLPYRLFVGDALDESRLSEVFQQTRPQVVFHAAAYKHVPLMELNPVEAIKNNLLGTQKVAFMADRSGVERFVLISTDKAVDPINIMGASKRAAELVIQCLPQVGSGKYITVRFGNVVGSEGSVVPLFQSQIADGGPVTVTHREATRFFMSIPEATQLILEAGALGQGGEIFLLDMGKPVRIVSLAEDLIRLSGREPHTDVEIRITGLRPGEKLHEQLRAKDENAIPTPHPKIHILKPPSVDQMKILQETSHLSRLIVSANGNPVPTHTLIAQLRKILPEYSPSPEVLHHIRSS